MSEDKITDPPETRRKDESYEMHGETIQDPYLWLENAEDKDVENWIESQNEYADCFLEKIDVRDSLRSRIEELARTVEYEPIKPTENGYFQRIRQPEEDRSVLYHFDEIDGNRRKLIDPNEFEESVSLSWYFPSPDGSLVANLIDEGGQENYDVHIMDVETGDDIEVLSNCGRVDISWVVNGTGNGIEGYYYVTTGDTSEEGQLDKKLRYHKLGTQPEDDLIIKDDFAPQVWPATETATDGDHVVVHFMEGWERTDLYYVDHEKVRDAYSEKRDIELQPLITGFDKIFEPVVVGDDCYLKTSYEAPNYRVGRLDLSEVESIDGPDAISSVVPEDDDAILKEVSVTEDRLVVRRNRDVVSELIVYDRTGEYITNLELPGPGSVEEQNSHPYANEVFFTYESFDHPLTVMRWSGDETKENDVQTVVNQNVEINANLSVSQEWVTSNDGTEVPAFVVRRDDVKPDASNPTLLYAYGGFEISLTPSFMQFVVPFLEDGGVFAIANLRGGGEFGEEWHHAGRRESKQRTFDDVSAVAEHLRDRWAEKLGILGGSNGGLTVGAAITQQPDLYDVALCHVPLLDKLRYHTSFLGKTWTSEYGNPDDPEEFKWVYDYSPYHHVENSVYPDILFTTAEGDTRVAPFHARKMTARMQNRSKNTLVLLKTYRSTGHGTGKPISKIVNEQVDQWSFLYDRLGVRKKE